MAFFVVQRDADSGLNIPLPDSYPTREAAIAALSSATASGSLTLTGEVFIADLGTAVPVLLMAVPSSPPVEAPVAEPGADEAAPLAEETATEPAAEETAPAIDEIAPEPVIEEPEAEPDELEPESLDEQAAAEVYSGASFLGDEQSLAAALKRAASSLEDEGIVAPASIESAPSEDSDEPETAAEWPWANVEAYTAEAEPESEPEPEPVDESTAIDAAAVEDDAGEAEEGAAEVPDAEESGQVDETAAPAETADAVAEEPVEIEEPVIADVADESPYLEAPAAEVLEPLSIAGITDTEPVAEDAAAEEALTLPEDQPIITSAPLDGEDAYVPRPVILGDYADVVVPGGDAEFEPVSEPASVQEAEVIAAAVEPLTGYEAQGDVGFEEYTCQDCVYANTCPKVGEATPADCGSFQWRAE